VKVPNPFKRRRRPNRRSKPIPVRMIALVLLCLAIPGALVVAGLHEQNLATRANPLAVKPALGAARASTPLFSVRRIPSTVAQPLVVEPLRKKLANVEKQIPATSCAMVTADGVPMLEHEADTALIPASNMKVITAAVALDVMGPDYRYTTKLYAAISKSDPSLVYDITLIGSGDPLLSTEKFREASKDYKYYANPPWTDLEDLARQMQAKGIKRLSGDVYADGRHYDTTDLGVVSNSVSPIGGLMANDSRTDYGEDFDLRAKDPALHAASQLNKNLLKYGITTTLAAAARVVRSDEPAASTVDTEVASVTSAPLKDIVANMLTSSDNDTAEMLLREIAFKKGKPTTRAGGAEAVREVLQSWGVSVEGLNVVDGSGLDRANATTCRMLLGALQHEGPSSDFARGLPVPGGPGTLKDTLGQCPVKDTLSAKTGSLSQVRSLSGFVTAIGGHVITFSALLNGLPARAELAPAGRVFAALCDAFSAFPGRLDLVAFGVQAPVGS
jgi:serine-type D-Ala-D-Ala carboxypeptidase/endopeptidase (penicillin-binding protein 4)